MVLEPILIQELNLVQHAHLTLIVTVRQQQLSLLTRAHQATFVKVGWVSSHTVLFMHVEQDIIALIQLNIHALPAHTIQF